MELFFNLNYFLKKIETYTELEIFIKQINKTKAQIINIIKDDLSYIVIYQNHKEVE